ncbi:MAG: hypothetical protein SGJ04_01155 [Bacteroidota bacterium]|nr:hypothetical protein [Bacteroidota bacterium]
MKPETFDGLQMVVENSAKLRDEFVANGIEVSDVDTQEWGIFIYVKDPDGNQLIFQHLVPYNA